MTTITDKGCIRPFLLAQGEWQKAQDLDGAIKRSDKEYKALERKHDSYWPLPWRTIRTELREQMAMKKIETDMLVTERVEVSKSASTYFDMAKKCIELNQSMIKLSSDEDRTFAKDLKSLTDRIWSFQLWRGLG